MDHQSDVMSSVLGEKPTTLKGGNVDGPSSLFTIQFNSKLKTQNYIKLESDF